MPPLVTDPPSTSNLAPTPLDAPATPLASSSAHSHLPTPAPASASAPVPALALVLPLDPVLDPVPVPALSNDSQNALVTQNTLSLLVAPVALTESLPHTVETTTNSATPGSSTDPSTSALGSGGNSDGQIGAPDVPSTPDMSKTTSKKTTGRKKGAKKPTVSAR